MASGVPFQSTLQNGLRLWKTWHAKYHSHAQIGIIADNRSNSQKRHTILFCMENTADSEMEEMLRNRNAVLWGLQSSSSCHIQWQVWENCKTLKFVSIVKSFALFSICSIIKGGSKVVIKN